MDRVCFRCKVEKPQAQFAKPKRLGGWCRECQAAYSREYYKKNKDRLLAKCKVYHKVKMSGDPEYRQAHNERNAKWREENRTKANALKTEWRRKNPRSHAAHEAKRRAAKKNCEGSHTARDVEVIFKRQGGKCAYCQRTVNEYHVDHVMPLSRGGSNGPENLAIACPTCNLKKNNKTVSEFIGGCHR